MKKAAVYCLCIFLIILLVIFIRNGCIRAEYTDYLQLLPSSEIESIEVQCGGETTNIEDVQLITKIAQTLSEMKLGGRADVSFPGAIATVITVYAKSETPVRMTLPSFGMSENNCAVKAYFHATILGKDAAAMLAELLD